MAKYGVDAATGKFYKQGESGLPEEVSATEYYKRQFADPSATEAALASYIDRKMKPLTKLGVPEVSDVGMVAEVGRETHPWASMAGDMGAYIDPTIPGKLVAGTLGAAFQGMAMSNPGDEATDAVFGALGQRIGDMGERVLGKVSNMWRASKTTDDIPAPVKDWMDLGGPTTPGERAGNSWLQQTEKDMRSYPGAADVMDEADDAKKAFMNKKAVEAVGLDPDEFPMMDELAQKKVQDNYADAVYPMFENIKGVELPEELVEILEATPGMTSKARLKQWKKLYNFDYEPGLDGATGTASIDGMGLRAMRDKLGRLGAGTGDLSDYGKQGVGEIDEFIEELVPEGGQELYKQQRRNVNIANNLGTQDSYGNINPLSAYRKLSDTSKLPYNDESFNALKRTVQVGSGPDMNRLLTKQGVSNKGGNPVRAFLGKPIGEAYMSGKYMPRGILNPYEPIGLGANIGRAGLLGSAE